MPTQEDLDKYTQLVLRIYAIDANAGAYLTGDVFKLKAFNPTGDIRGCFVWHTSPQGHEYWHNIERQLGQDSL